MSYAKVYEEEHPTSLDAEANDSTGVKITVNRNSIDDRFSILGFTVRTGGLPFFEVLRTTDRELFAP